MPSAESLCLYRQVLEALQQKRPAEALLLAQQLQEQLPEWGLTQHVRGVLALQAGQPEAALALWRQGLGQMPGEPRLLDPLFKLLLQMRREDEALQLFNEVCREGVLAKYLLKWLPLFQQRFPETVQEGLENALYRQPENHALLEAYLTLQKEQPERVLKLLEKLVPAYPRAGRWVLLGKFYAEQGQLQAAVEAFQSALALEPTHASAHSHLATVLAAHQREADALPHFRAVVKQTPQLGKLLLELSQRLLRAGQYALAADYLDLCLAIPEHTGIPLHQLLFMRASCAHYQLEPDLKQRFFKAAAQAAPHPLLYAPEALNALPYVYRSQAELSETRQRFIQGVAKLKRDIWRAARQGADPRLLAQYRSPPFLLAYQGQDDTALMRDLGQFWTDFMRQHRLLHEVQRAPASGRPLRVGFVSRYFYNHSVLFCYGNLLCDLAADPEFDVRCFHLGDKLDARSQWLKEQIQGFVHLGGHTAPEKVILEQELDILIYTDIGMDAPTYALAMHRLAPIQAVLSGHPVTSGLPNQDYYFSSSLAEPENAQSHYTETLLALSGAYTRYDMPVPPPVLRTRTELGLSEREHVYLCPMTLFKLHPDYDAAIVDILRADPQACFYIVRLGQSHYHEVVQARVRARDPQVADRLRVLPWMSQPDFYSALLQADVVLDSFHFGAGTTIRMVLGLGKPFPSWPSAFNRGRMVLRSYRRMGLDQRVPLTQEAFVDEAVRLACDRDWRETCAQEIRARRELLFGPADGLTEFKDCLRQAVAVWPNRLPSLL